ncbi:hypothetical protein [Streptomyces sp. IB2014 016-6]|uniref:hypothetical protein n=1 Tax=Streptomyces sp. IB2014 016-6 TaxID=2517818 RepID=UPI0011C8CE78|nr:hypothetical protein [Streptomyces sp. IB2014 016-6]TXL91723.1 hypothetical protein EW053_05245 [Streptomyces sp. IB2014 016-6]
MSGSEARRLLSRLMNAFGTDGVLVVRKLDSGSDNDHDTAQLLGPGAALAWPKCECGSPKCPDYVPPAPPPTGLSARLAERNQHSRRGRL